MIIRHHASAHLSVMAEHEEEATRGRGPAHATLPVVEAGLPLQMVKQGATWTAVRASLGGGGTACCGAARMSGLTRYPNTL